MYLTDLDQAVTSGTFTKLTEDNNTDQHFKWSKVAALRLSELYQEGRYFAKFKDKTTKNKVIWNEIASELRKEGKEVTGEQYNTKFQNMKGIIWNAKTTTSILASCHISVIFMMR